MQATTSKRHNNWLVNLLVGKQRDTIIQALSNKWKSLQLSQRQLCDLELLMNGGFSPLKTYLGRADYEGLLTYTRLESDELRAVPVTLDVDKRFPEVATELKKSQLKQADKGFTIFFTGLPAAGKSTTANALKLKLQKLDKRLVSVIDGDEVRNQFSSELGFSREDRNHNVRRVGIMASEITKQGGIAICALIAPFDDIRKEVRRQITADGGFVLAYVATPIELCEARDQKGLYRKARAGDVPEFTGISSPYEVPKDYEIYFDTSNDSPDQLTDQILSYLRLNGYIDF